MAGSSGGKWAAVLGRFLLALLLVYGTFNPLGRSWFHWAVLPVVQDPGSVTGIGPLKVLVGLLLLIGGVLLWRPIRWSVRSAGGASAIVHLGLISVALILAVGSGWSIITRKVTGQVDTDEVN